MSQRHGKACRPITRVDLLNELQGLVAFPCRRDCFRDNDRRLLPDVGVQIERVFRILGAANPDRIHLHQHEIDRVRRLEPHFARSDTEAELARSREHLLPRGSSVMGVAGVGVPCGLNRSSRT